MAPDDRLDYLKSAWEEASNDPHPGLDPEPVFARLRATFAEMSKNGALQSDLLPEEDDVCSDAPL